MRTEDDLRAAFASRAADAPSARGVLAEVKAAQLSPQRKWLAPLGAVAAAAVIAGVSVPLALHGGGGGGTASRNADKAAGPAQGLSEAGPSAPALCRPDQVSLTLRWSGSTGTLTATNHGGASCELPRQLTLLAAGAQPPPTGATGLLAADRKATATVTWTGCPADANPSLHANWGAGDVPVSYQNYVALSCGLHAEKITPHLSVGWFMGLS